MLLAAGAECFGQSTNLEKLGDLLVIVAGCPSFAVDVLEDEQVRVGGILLCSPGQGLGLELAQCHFAIVDTLNVCRQAVRVSHGIHVLARLVAGIFCHHEIEAISQAVGDGMI